MKRLSRRLVSLIETLQAISLAQWGSWASCICGPGWASFTSRSSPTFSLDGLFGGVCRSRFEEIETPMPSSRRSVSGRTLIKLIHHSDRGVQYVSIRYIDKLAEAGIEPSAGRVDVSYDNAMAEMILVCSRLK
jgi:transposase InsO family protein